MAEVYLTEDQFAARGHFSSRTASRMRSDGSGPPFVRATPGNTRGRVLYRESDVERWLASRLRTSTSDPGEGGRP